MHDDSLHEIQLHGKQLVFLFMAATVVAVVIFLCGVMVGRGVSQRAGTAPATPEQAVVDPTAAVRQLPPPLAVASTGDGPLTATETLTYPNRLSDAAPPTETLRPLAETAVLTEPPRPVATTEPARKPARLAAATRAPRPSAPAPRTAAAPSTSAPDRASSSAPRPAPASASTTDSSSRPSLAEPVGGGGFVVQVAAVRARADAETIANRLSAKGYPTFITSAGANFRVRVGKYGDRKAAEAIARRLEREERVRAPWITR